MSGDPHWEFLRKAGCTVYEPTRMVITNGNGINMHGVEVIRPVKKCRYCGMDDFAHNQCQRCGARQA